MPQPITRVLPKVTGLRFGPTAIDHIDEQLIRRVGHVTTLYAALEYQYARSVAKLLGPKADLGPALLKIWRTKKGVVRDVMNAAADVELEGDDLELFRIISKFAGSVGRRRNDVAHGLAGFCPDLPAAMLITADVAMLDFHVAADRAYDAIAKGSIGELLPIDHDQIYVYTAEDLDSLIADVLQARGNFLLFWMMREAPSPIERDKHFSVLVARPEIAAFFKPSVE